MKLFQYKLWAGLCVLSLMFFSPELKAEELPVISAAQEQIYPIAIVPQSFPIYLYKTVVPKANIDVVALREALIAQANEHPYLHPVSSSDIEHAFMSSDLGQTDAFMQSEIDMEYVKNFMSNQNYHSAIDLTKRVIDNYQKSLIAYFAPQTVAQAYQQLAYALIAQYQDDPDTNYDRLHPARLAFIELIRLAPYLTMLEGRQSQERVMLYDEALDLFMSNEAYRTTPTKDASALAQKLSVKLLLFPRLVEDLNGDFVLEIDAYNAVSQTMDTLKAHISIDDPETTSQTVADAASLILNSLYDCLEVEQPKPQFVEKTKAHRAALHIGPSYSSFINYPTDEALNNVGGHIFFSYMFDEHFFIRAGFEILAVLQDPAHELYDNFEVYQIPVLVGIAQEWRWFRIFMALGPDFSFSSSYTISRSTICKTFGTHDLECLPKDVTKNKDPFAFLADFVLGVAFGLDPFYAVIESTFGISAYPSEGKVFKHPVGLRLSLQYWF